MLLKHFCRLIATLARRVRARALRILTPVRQAPSDGICYYHFVSSQPAYRVCLPQSVHQSIRQRTGLLHSHTHSMHALPDVEGVRETVPRHATSPLERKMVTIAVTGTVSAIQSSPVQLGCFVTIFYRELLVTYLGMCARFRPPLRNAHTVRCENDRSLVMNAGDKRWGAMIGGRPVGLAVCGRIFRKWRFRKGIFFQRPCGSWRLAEDRLWWFGIPE
uniref:Putative secreted protein n=1 Tax=Anopheles marajoara TaxID=58244 RepID=A0A2M4C5P9_9DIPT